MNRDAMTAGLRTPATLPESLPEPPHLLAGRCWIALRGAARLSARLGLRGGEVLRELKDAQAHRAAGFASFSDFARERLQLSPRTARRQVALAETLSGGEALREAYLEGRLSACKVLALRQVTGTEALPFWIELAESLTVRALEARLNEPLPAEGAPATRRIVFPAPSPAALAWNQGLAAARRVLGWNAPAHRCIEAVLAEFEDEADPGTQVDATGTEGHSWRTESRAEARAAASPPPAAAVTAEPPPRPLPGTTPSLSEADARSLRQMLARIEPEIESIRARIPEPKQTGLRSAGSGPAMMELLREYGSLAGLTRQLRLLEGRLLYLVWSHRLHHALGSTTLAEFSETHLGLSERTARERVRRAFLFQEETRLALAYRRGEIGCTQARLVNRISLNATLERHVRRAREVTVRQLEREVRFLEQLAEFAPEVWRRHPGPLPDPELETALLEALKRRGADPASVLEDLRRRGLEGDEPAPDPAADPRIMARLETLLEMLILQAYPDDRQMLAAPAADAGGGNAAPAAVWGRHQWTTISFLAPPSLFENWNQALHRLRAARGALPTWACAVLLVRHALEVWLAHDPETRPTEHAILERDDYACRAPGCSSRRNLEVHHIRFRSQGGTNHAWNKVTLCHIHHRHVLHTGAMHVAGKAPGDLEWRMGSGKDGIAVVALRGELIVSGSTR